MRLEPSTYRRTGTSQGVWRRRIYSIAGVSLLATWLFVSYCWVVSYRGAVGIDYSAGDTFAHVTFDHANVWIRYQHERVGEASPVAERYWDVDFWPARRNPGVSFFDARPDLMTTDFLFQHLTTADIEGFDPAVFGDVDMRFFELVLPCWLLWTCMSVALMPFLVRYFRERRVHRRIAAGRCAACGYDMQATPERCPECGAVPRDPPHNPPMQRTATAGAGAVE